MKTIVDKRAILENQNVFEAQFKTSVPRTILVIAHNRQVYWDEKNSFWYSSDQTKSEHKKNAHFNFFGNSLRENNVRNELALQINIPAQGINRRFQGCFASDKLGIYVIHRGKLGNGKGSILKLAQIKKWIIEFEDGDKISKGIYIGRLKDNESHNRINCRISCLISIISTHKPQTF